MIAPRLAALGLTWPQETAYENLVGAGGARSAPEIGRVLGLAPEATVELLESLRERGLAAVSGTGYRANPPEVALGTLVAEHDQELGRIRRLTAELQEQYRDAVRGREAAQFVEVVTGQDQVNRYYLHLVQRARYGLDVLTKPPYLAGAGVPQTLHAEDAGIRRGVRFRAVYDGDALDEENTLAIARQSIEFGEEARAIGGLPFKLAIVDDSVGLMPLDIRFPARGALLVHASALLDALIALFEGIWARAVPMRADRLADGVSELADRAAEVLRLMAAGLKDEAIARALHVSRRTVQKHITEIMTTLGARNRFQAALLASKRGWVG